MRVNRESAGLVANSLKDALTDLRKIIEEEGVKGTIAAPREYPLAKSVTAQDLEEISRLPFEVLLTEHDAGLTMLTGTRTSAVPNDEKGRPDWDAHTRMLRESRFTIHNHPRGKARPSGGDLSVSSRSVSEVDIVLGRKGIAVFKSHSPMDAIQAEFSPTRFWASAVGGKHETDHFLKKGYIDAWIPWGDPRIDLICAYINGERSWKEYQQEVTQKVN